LADYGADCNEKDEKGNTYLHIAAMSGHVNMFMFFLTKKVPLNGKNNYGRTAIDLAHDKQNEELIGYLREKFDMT